MAKDGLKKKKKKKKRGQRDMLFSSSLKPYSSIYRESKDEMKSEHDAKVMKDISNLEWTKDVGQMSWNDATNKAPNGYRLPTAQELWSAVGTVKGFKNAMYWSSTSFSEDNSFAWAIHLGYEYLQEKEKDNELFVKYVKEKI